MIRYLLALALALFAAPAAAAPIVGINLSGCEFYAPGDLCPTAADVNAAIDQGFGYIRLPFLGKQAANPQAIARVQAAYAAADARHVPLALDRHDNVWLPAAQQVAFWTPILRTMPNAVVDLVNEPKAVGWMQWAAETKATIAGLRKAGFTNRILIEWPGWSAMWLFDAGEKVSQPCASAMCALDRTPGPLDPIDNTAVSPHRYLDKGTSGTSAECNPVLTALEGRVPEFVAQVRKRHLRVVIGEFAGGGTQKVAASCVPVLTATMAAIRAAPDVFDAVLIWGGGRGWPDNYIFRIAPPVKAIGKARVASPYLDLLGVR